RAQGEGAVEKAKGCVQEEKQEGVRRCVLVTILCRTQGHPRVTTIPILLSILFLVLFRFRRAGVFERMQEEDHKAWLASPQSHPLYK
ncbi:hypothetical protein N9K47_00495, partial [bacterium]|nr:hypothetical protein [bacterium]